MKRLWRWLREKVLAIARIDSTPPRIAAGIGVGAFIAMFPITGFQFLTGLALSFIFRVNKIAVVATTQLLCNPLTLPFLFFLDYKIGERLLGHDSAMTLEAFRILLREASIRNAFVVFKTVAAPLYLGSAVTGPCLGLIAFVAGYFFVKRFKRKRR